MDKHEHIHDENCTCGEKHEHEHHHHHDSENHHIHDENCTCGCHDTHAAELPQGLFLEISHHDESIVASYKFNLDSTDAGEKQNKADNFIKQIGEGINNAGGFIGHIKAIVKIADKGYKISLTLDEIDKTDIDISSIYVEGVAIVFNIPEDTLMQIICDSYKNL